MIGSNELIGYGRAKRTGSGMKERERRVQNEKDTVIIREEKTIKDFFGYSSVRSLPGC
jgi:hypothetical protein